MADTPQQPPKRPRQQPTEAGGSPIDPKQLLREELLCFLVMLQRSRRLSEEDMKIVLDRIHMYDPLLEEDPWVQELMAKERVQSLAEGRTEGELRALRSTLSDFVQFRFPNLVILAEVRASQMEQPELLQRLFQQIMQAPDENAARLILETFPNA